MLLAFLQVFALTSRIGQKKSLCLNELGEVMNFSEVFCRQKHFCLLRRLTDRVKNVVKESMKFTNDVAEMKGNLVVSEVLFFFSFGTIKKGRRAKLKFMLIDDFHDFMLYMAFKTLETYI